jgi:hypothetical protein
VHHGHNQDFVWPVAVDHEVREAMQETAANIIASREMLETRVNQRIAADTIKGVLDILGKVVAEVRALMVVPFRRFFDFQIGCRQSTKDQAFALRARRSASRSRI